MPKGRLADDTFEKLVELGSTTAKKAGKTVVKTFTTQKVLENTIESVLGTRPTGTTENGEKKKPNNFTPVDFEDLKKKHALKDKEKETALRQRLFQLVKEGEKDMANTVAKKHRERQGQMELEEQERKKREEEKKLAEQSSDIPKGKERKSIFSPLKKVVEKRAELRPGSGKQ
jgi:hypothetical protein